MTKEQLAILTNIIGAVESGGQVYGKRRYEAYAGKKANSANEKTCTLGWAQNYGNEGRTLCKMVLATDPTVFRKADTAGIETKLNTDWEATGWNPSAAEKTALIAIITTDAGKKCQDNLFEQLMATYIKSAESFGVTSVQAQMMWCEIEHLGGLKPVQRIFKRAAKPYTPDTIFTSLLQDQQDTSNGNQVGDKLYQSRHECCVKWIKQYVTESTTAASTSGSGLTAEKILNVERQWVGWGRSNGKQKTIIDIYNNDDPNHLPRGYKVQYGDSYCDVTQSAAAIKADMKALIGKECGVEEHVKIFKNMGIWNEDGTITPKAGYLIVFNWGKATQPNDGYSDHIGIVESVKDGTIVTIEGNFGGEVKRRSIPVGWGYIRGYAIPKYDSSAGQGSGSSNNGGQTSSGSTSLCRTPQWVGRVDADILNVRKWAGTEYANIKSWPKLGYGNLVDVCDKVYSAKGEIWYYIRIDGRIYGFVHSAYITRV